MRPLICPGCNTRLRVPEKRAGKTVVCGRCKEKIRVPELQDQADPFAGLGTGVTTIADRQQVTQRKAAHKLTPVEVGFALIIGLLGAAAGLFLVGDYLYPVLFPRPTGLSDPFDPRFDAWLSAQRAFGLAAATALFLVGFGSVTVLCKLEKQAT